MKFPNASDSFKRRNPHLFGMGGVQPEVRQPKAVLPLVEKPPGHKPRRSRMATSRPRIRVGLVNFRRRLLDSDNLITGYKAFRDAIARSLGVDDKDSVIEWEYSQILTRGKQGTIVRIEKM